MKTDKKSKIYKNQGKCEFDKTCRPRHIVKHPRHCTQDLNKRSNNFDLSKVAIPLFSIFDTYFGTKKDTKYTQKDGKGKRGQKDKGICQTRSTWAFRTRSALFDISISTNQTQGTTVPVQALFIGMCKHCTVSI
jgi:hypothetical protein